MAETWCIDMPMCRPRTVDDDDDHHHHHHHHHHYYLLTYWQLCIHLLCSSYNKFI